MNKEHPAVPRLSSYPWYFEDWICSETRSSMTFTERGIYRDLLDFCWYYGSLPGDEKTLKKVLLMTGKGPQRGLKSALNKFVLREDGRYHHPKVDEKRNSLVELSLARGKAGRKGGLAKAENVARARILPQQTAAPLTSYSYSSSSASAEQPLNGASGAAFPVLDKSINTGAKGDCFRAREEKNAAPADAVVVSLEPLLEELADIYRQGGVPLSEPHRQQALRFLNALAPDQRDRAFTRLPDYCKWAFVSGRWNNPRMTKSLLHVLRDGDWDVELSMRRLPEAETDLSPRQRAMVQAERRFLRSKGVSC